MTEYLLKILPATATMIGIALTLFLTVMKTVKSIRTDISTISKDIAVINANIENQKAVNGTQNIDIKNFTDENRKLQADIMEAFSEIKSQIFDRSDKVYQTISVCNERHNRLKQD